MQRRDRFRLSSTPHKRHRAIARVYGGREASNSQQFSGPVIQGLAVLRELGRAVG